ncbi:hypothetical protein B7P43_G16805 [Cryptotermes secundus]|uniref:Uncharacterized protein n=1 Tax=Cryptotermes secundus TaxID=105785 RepID=A0A2J7Q5C3_9NEOP|nr:hypothetical protein B7P43_G16805 [Cryptotermes secundus]
MRLKGNKLFVRRSAGSSRRVHRDYFFNRNRNVPLGDVQRVSDIFSTEPGDKQTTLNMGYDELRKKSDEKLLHSQLKPLILMLQLLGCFPVEMSKSGVLTFRALSPVMAYSVCLYALVNTATYFGLRYKIIPFFQKDDELENRVYIAMLFLLVLSFLYVPVFTWLDAPKAIQYFEEWKQFQVRTDIVSVNGQPAMVREGRGRQPRDGIYG